MTAPTQRPPYATFETAPERLAQAVADLVRLVDAESTSGVEAAGVDAAEAVCRGLGLPVTRMPVAPGRDNLLIGASAPDIVLCTHLDTVPPYIPASEDAHAVHGRGSADAKGVAIAMLYALDAVRAELPATAERAACLLVVGEETDHAGAHAAVASGLAPRWIILGEPCGMAPAIAQKGLLKLRLTALGRAAHSAYPEVGASAVHLLLDGLGALRGAPLPSDPVLGETTLNVGQIQGGIAANVIAPSAEATLLIRCAAPVDAVLADVVGRLPAGIDATELSRAEPREYETLDETPGPAVPFNTDGHILSAMGARLMLMGPGDMRCAHAAGEHLSKADLADGITRYARTLARLL